MKFLKILKNLLSKKIEEEFLGNIYENQWIPLLEKPLDRIAVIGNRKEFIDYIPKCSASRLINITCLEEIKQSQKIDGYSIAGKIEDHERVMNEVFKKKR